MRDLTGYQPLVPAAAAVAGGIVGDRVWAMSAGVWGLVAAAAVGAWGVVWLRRWERVGALLIWVACAATGAAWHHCCWSLFPRDDLGHFAKATTEPVCLEAVALRSARVVPPAPPDPLRSLTAGEQTRIELQVLAIRDRTQWRGVSGCAELLILGRRGDVRAGDRLRVFANLKTPVVTENPGQFDYTRYLRADRRRAMLHAEHPEAVQILESGRLNWFATALDVVRRRNKACFDRCLSPKRIGLASAVLLGAREELDPEQSAAFMETGTVHLLVVSGLNVGILAGALWWLLRRAPIPQGASMGVVGLVTAAYMILTDAEPPIVRATVLVLGGLLALCVGRRGRSMNFLAAAALVVVAINPVDVFSVGAQLSFLCVAGMAWLIPQWIDPAAPRTPFERLIEGSRSKWERVVRAGLRLLVMSVLISVLTGPLIAARFHLVAPVAPPLNVLLWLPVSTGTLSGFGLLLFGWLWPLGDVLGWCCNASMWALQAGVDIARRLPGSHFWIAGPPDWWLAGFYGSVAFAAGRPQWVSWTKLAGLLGVWSLIGYGVPWISARSTALECTFLSVGHGSATVLRLPDGRTLVYDAGHLGSPRVAARAVEGFLWSEGIGRVDWIVVSHADTDHYNAVPELLDRFRVGEVCVSPVMFRGRGKALGALREALARNGITPRGIGAGEVLCAGPCTVRVVHPPPEGVEGSDNANSVVLVVEYLGQRILLPGDLDSPGLEQLTSKRPEKCEVLLAPHHGSKRSHPEALANWSGTQWVVVSGGDRSGGGEAVAGKDSTARVVLSTARSGAIRVRIDEHGLAVKGYLGTRPDGVQEISQPAGDGTQASAGASKGSTAMEHARIVRERAPRGEASERRMD